MIDWLIVYRLLRYSFICLWATRHRCQDKWRQLAGWIDALVLWNSLLCFPGSLEVLFLRHNTHPTLHSGNNRLKVINLWGVLIDKDPPVWLVMWQLTQMKALSQIYDKLLCSDLELSIVLLWHMLFYQLNSIHLYWPYVLFTSRAPTSNSWLVKNVTVIILL